MAQGRRPPPQAGGGQQADHATTCGQAGMGAAAGGCGWRGFGRPYIRDRTAGRAGMWCREKLAQPGDPAGSFQTRRRGDAARKETGRREQGQFARSDDADAGAADVARQPCCASGERLVGPWLSSTDNRTEPMEGLEPEADCVNCEGRGSHPACRSLRRPGAEARWRAEAALAGEARWRGKRRSWSEAEWARLVPEASQAARRARTRKRISERKPAGAEARQQA